MSSCPPVTRTVGAQLWQVSLMTWATVTTPTKPLEMVSSALLPPLSDLSPWTPPKHASLSPLWPLPSPRPQVLLLVLPHTSSSPAQAKPTSFHLSSPRLQSSAHVPSWLGSFSIFSPSLHLTIFSSVRISSSSLSKSPSWVPLKRASLNSHGTPTSHAPPLSPVTF